MYNHLFCRWDMPKPKNFYWSADMVRIITEIQELSFETNVEKKLGCTDPPLIRIELQRIVPDELHLLLRVTGTAPLTYFLFLIPCCLTIAVGTYWMGDVNRG